MTPDQSIGQPRHLSSIDVYAMVEQRLGKEEITDAAAVTVASWWQAPAGWGLPFAVLASTGRFNATELLQAISVTRPEARTEADNHALDMLATWAMHRHDALT